jgi:hypothetical protein
MDSFEGRALFDSSGYKIGDIETVLRGDGPAFVLVKSGLFGTIRRLVPANDVREVRKPSVKRGPGPALKNLAAGSWRSSKAPSDSPRPINREE